MQPARPVAGFLLLTVAATIGADTGEDRTPTVETASRVYLEEMTIIGSRDQARQLTGAATYIGPEELEKFAYADVQRVARSVPGVSIQVEDGYGLRPNISIRGVATERSGRITLLEDNVLIAPAPYSAPSAYYFPTPGRMHAYEVVKGPASITQGPYTIGGAFNMISTPIPRELSGAVFAEAGEDETYRVHGHYGGYLESGIGFLVETHQWDSDGFQSIDRNDNDTGLDVEDYTVKLSYAPVGSRHRFDLKYQYADQNSDQSYLGLTDADFDDDAFRRYGLSTLDNIDTEHEQWILSYQFALNDAVAFTVTGYDNDHERDWFKTEGIDFDGSAVAEDFDRTSWFNVVQAINRGEGVDGVTPAEMQAILEGDLDTAPGSIQLRSNAREYYSRGVQGGVDLLFDTGGLSHDVEFRLRYHEDEEDRLQRNSTYSQVGGELVLDDFGLLGNAGNRVQEAEAWAVHVYDRIEFGQWVFTPGMRYEDIDQKRTRWETRLGQTDNPASREPDNLRDTRENKTTVWLPGLGVLYNVNDNWALLGGVHKGFSAPSNATDVDEEDAINYEFGFRYQGGRAWADVVGFYTDYDNLLGECTSSSGSNCEIGDAFNGDAASIFGVEVEAGIDLLQDAPVQIPVRLTYTYMDGEFDSDVADTAFFGDVSDGDPLPYIPDHQFLLSVGLTGGRWAAYLNANYVDDVCVRASCGAFEKTDDTLVLDLSGRYDINQTFSLFARVENLTEEEDLMGRQPYGARPNKDRTAAIGVRASF